MISFVVLTFALEAGFMPDNFTKFNDSIYSKQTEFADISMEIEAWKTFYFSYSNRMEATYLTGIVIVPESERYQVKTGFRFNDFDIGVNHVCVHPIQSFTAAGIINDNQIFQWSNEIFIKYTAKFNL